MEKLNYNYADVLESYTIDDIAEESSLSYQQVVKSTAYQELEKCVKNAKKLESVARSKNDPASWKTALAEYKRILSLISDVKNMINAGDSGVTKTLKSMPLAGNPFASLNIRLERFKKSANNRIEYIQNMINK